MYWLGFGHGVIAAGFVAFIGIACVGLFGARFIARLAAANRERVKSARYDHTLPPAAAAAAAMSKQKGS